MTGLIELPQLNWTSFEAASAQAAELLNHMSDRHILKQLVYGLLSNDRLVDLSERHTPFTKLVLIDSPEHNLRVRLHVWKQSAAERAHQHRFPIVTRILHGSYEHRLYGLDPSDQIRQTEAKLDNMDPEHPDVSASAIDSSSLKVLMTSLLKAGDGYSLHHEAIHATIPGPDCVSLCLRGPAQTEASVVVDLSTNKTYWRWGRLNEQSERINDHRLSLDQLRDVIKQLENFNLI